MKKTKPAEGRKRKACKANGRLRTIFEQMPEIIREEETPCHEAARYTTTSGTAFLPHGGHCSAGEPGGDPGKQRWGTIHRGSLPFESDDGAVRTAGGGKGAEKWASGYCRKERRQRRSSAAN